MSLPSAKSMQKKETKKGMQILDSSAMVPNSVASCTPMEGDLICVIRMEETE